MTTKNIPVNVYRESQRIMVSAPVPGLEPENIHVAVEGKKVSIRSPQRGPEQDRTGQYLQENWTAGPYYGEVELPQWVDVDHANATYDNGVLVVIFPRSENPTSGVVTLAKVGTFKGQHIGNVGRDLHQR